MMEDIITKIVTADHATTTALIVLFFILMRWLMSQYNDVLKGLRRSVDVNTLTSLAVLQTLAKHDLTETLFNPREIPIQPEARVALAMQKGKEISDEIEKVRAAIAAGVK